MTDLDELQKRVVGFRDARDWKQFHNPKDVAISLALEAAEVMEHFQWKSPQEIEKHLKSHRAEFEDEVIDVLYWVLLLAHDNNINLKRAFERKMKQNNKKYPVAKAKGRHTKYTDL